MCQRRVGPWFARRAQGGSTYANKTGGRYKHVEAGSAYNDVTVAIGRHFIEGDFYAEHVELHGSWVVADVKIKRFVDDVFDFVNDEGDIPLGDLIEGRIPINPTGYGTVPNVWAQTLIDEKKAYAYDIHIEWFEQFNHTWKIP